MLRALGILFIVCCCFAAGVLGVGGTLLAVHFGSRLLPPVGITLTGGSEVAESADSAPPQLLPVASPGPLPSDNHQLRALSEQSLPSQSLLGHSPVPQVAWAANPPAGGGIQLVADATSQPAITTIEETMSDGAIYLINVKAVGPSQNIYLQGNKISVTVSGLTQGTTYKVNDSDPEEVTADGTGISTFAVTLPGPGKQTLTLSESKDGTLTPLVTRQVIMPDETVAVPRLLYSKNGEYAPEKSITADGVVNVYDGALTLKGDSVPNAIYSEFAIYVKNSDGKYERAFSQTFRPSSSKEWTYRLNLADVPATNSPVEARLVLFARQSNEQVRPSQSLQLRLVKDKITTQNPPPTSTFKFIPVTAEDNGEEVDAIPAPADVISSKVKLKGTFDLLNPNMDMDILLADTYLLVFLDGDPQPAVRSTLADSSSDPSENDLTFTVPLPKLTNGGHRFKVRLARGDGLSKISQEIPFSVHTGGLHVVGVQPKNFGTAPGVKQLIVSFNRENPLDKDHAEEEKNYAFYPSNGSGTFNPETVRPINPTDAIYDLQTNSVALRFNVLNPDLYQLVIVGNPNSMALKGEAAGKPVIQDKYGNPLEVNGIAGVDYTEVLGKFDALASDDLSSTQIAGIADSTGRYVQYPEYTKFRNVPAGFNPSDKVISRIARLYYFRDAHRVVQIVNRKAKSYNRQAVAMDAQLADAAGRQADAKTDLRRSRELKAVRAAREARAAEEALEQHQTALMAARARKNSANQLVERTQDDLDTVKDSIAELENTNPQDSRLSGLKGRQTTLEKALSSARIEVDAVANDVSLEESRVNSLLGQVQSKRDEEITATEAWEEAEQGEQRAYEERFRREVAAKTADPDTYAPGQPVSDDPVEQVSLSVIGEGLIQMRGPRKGVNIVHTMINEMDAPVGQVRVSVHTIQINGEHGDRMEKVAMRIQRYIDHSRFLTVQSAEMLRKAVAQVAARAAEQSFALCPPGCPMETREIKYREAFFGSDFIDELLEMDSEFMHAGNKVLSLHSMDTTSLSSALFLLALAKNDIRQEILCEFMRMVEQQLPLDEQEYFQASNAEYKFRHQQFQFLAQNARFVSIRGFFDMQTSDRETMTPMQREFIRLAQIFKSRLITEVEWKQRVMERSLIEERIGNDYLKMLKAAEKKEEEARKKLETAEQGRRDQQKQLASQFGELETRALSLLDIGLPFQFLPDDLRRDVIEQIKRDSAASSSADLSLMKTANTYRKDLIKKISDGKYSTTINGTRIFFHVVKNEIGKEEDAKSEAVKVEATEDKTAEAEATEATQDEPPTEVEPAKAGGDTHNRFSDYHIKIDYAATSLNKDQVDQLWSKKFTQSVKELQAFLDFAKDVRFDDPNHQKKVSDVRRWFDKLGSSNKEKAFDPMNLENLFIVSLGPARLRSVEQLIRQVIHGYLDAAKRLELSMSDKDFDTKRALSDWKQIERGVESVFLPGEFSNKIRGWFTPINKQFSQLLSQEVEFQFARQNAEAARRPLDHKKFLDMLVDDVEEKYIELVDGTRAQIANIDNYLARISTALEDDVNTQFYQPVFRYIRETSYYYDVQLGQVQTESILTNNRMFGQVSPQATMEFDLPKRNILINEAFNSALAAYNDYGALMGDPNFLALARMYGGQPTAATYASGLPAPLVRDVLPGLPSQTDEQYLAQAKNNVPRIGSNLEALIPDPAVYKFETGTGFSVRPVIQPDGQAVVFHLNYMFTTNVREPVRADEKHLGRVKRHFIDTDVMTGNYELREVSRFQVGLKASRTARGVPLLEDLPGAGWLFRPLPQQESSLQENLIYAQSVIYPTLFDLMGLRWAPAVADLDPASLREREFVSQQRSKFLQNEVFDYSSLQVDEFLRIPPAERRGDLYRTQEAIPYAHPNGYSGPGLNIRQGTLQNGYSPVPYEGNPTLPNLEQITPLVPVPETTQEPPSQQNSTSQKSEGRDSMTPGRPGSRSTTRENPSGSTFPNDSPGLPAPKTESPGLIAPPVKVQLTPQRLIPAVPPEAFPPSPKPYGVRSGATLHNAPSGHPAERHGPDSAIIPVNAAENPPPRRSWIPRFLSR